ncbi:hypothetical protein SCLCIDRAFT_8099 [Scleroderma citrinum Foug A]|uniref:Uncharacterized protein n=1 Tax=Scleroderma citrinum Foug A TaxID=1036808 RepID=A0A0C2ZWQ9_9AGAM|nr:hypothetical protein SCLCIDRAFT_8099 [Scleroderma citrinum Foug A]
MANNQVVAIILPLRRCSPRLPRPFDENPILLVNMHHYASLTLTQGQQIVNFLNELASNPENTDWPNLTLQRLAHLLASLTPAYETALTLAQHDHNCRTADGLPVVMWPPHASNFRYMYHIHLSLQITKRLGISFD